MLAKPQLPRQLVPLADFVRAIPQDETIQGRLIERQDVPGVRAKALEIAESRLYYVSFAEASLEKTRFIDCLLDRCDFTAAQLPDAAWHRTTVLDSRATGLQLQGSLLQDCSFEKSKLNLANFRFSKLKNVQFLDCDLSEADFYGAELTDVTFKQCLLARTQFSSAKLKRVDLRTSDIAAILGVASLGGAIIDDKQLFALAPVLAAQFNITVE